MQVADSVRIDLSGGEWIDVKARRSWADTKRIESASFSMTRDDEGEIAPGVDLLEEGIAKILTYVVAWSIDRPLSRATLLSEDFDGALGDEIEIALIKHLAAQGRTAQGK